MDLFDLMRSRCKDLNDESLDRCAKYAAANGKGALAIHIDRPQASIIGASKSGDLGLLNVILFRWIITLEDTSNEEYVLVVNKSLCKAAKYGHGDIVNYLLYKATKEYRGRCAVLASQHGWEEMVENLSSQLGDHEDISEMFYQALTNHHRNIVEFLIERYSLKDDDCLIQCTHKCMYVAVSKLLENGADPSTNDNECLKISMRLKHEGLMRLLYTSATIYEHNILELMLLCCKYGHLSYIERLRTDYIISEDVFQSNKDLLFSTLCENGYKDIYDYMIQYNVSKSYSNNLPIRSTSKGGHLSLTKLLLRDPSVDPSDCRNNALHNAIRGGHCKIVRLLLRDKRVSSILNINLCRSLAVRYKRKKILKILESM